MICPRCGAPNSPSDKFCAVCSAPLGPPGAGQGFPPPQQYGNPPFPPPFNPQGPGMGGPGMPPPPYDPNQYGPPMGPPGMGPPGMGGPGMGGPGMGGPGMGGPGMGGGMGGPGMGPPGFDQGFAPPPPPPFPPPGQFGGDQGGYGAPPPPFPPPAEPDAFGQTAFAPQPAPNPPPIGGPPPPMGGAPMPPTGAMSGFGGDAGRTTGAGGSAKSRRALVGFLVSFQDDPLGKFWPLYQGRNLVGRAETGQEVDVPIGHGTTSTNHATIEADNGRLALSDLGSTNGTFHNEEAIGFQGRRDLRDGDKIRFGGFSVIVISVAARA